MQSILVPANLAWAKEAPLLLLICAQNNFEHNGQENKWGGFDAGTSMGYLILEAQKRGLSLHAMGGFDPDKAKEIFNLKELEPYAVLALGYSDEEHTASERKSVPDILIDRRNS